MRGFQVVLGAAVVIGPGCMMSNVVKPEVAQKHGAVHLECQAEKVKVSKVDDTTWKAEGCDSSVVMTCWTSVGQGEGTCTKQ
jgi:hypothetical protein